MKQRFAAVFLALLLTCILNLPASAQKSSLPFIADNYAEALAQARQQKLPLFVEVWAPW